MTLKEFSSSQNCDNKVLTDSECLAVFMILTGQDKFPLPSPLSVNRKKRVSSTNRGYGYDHLGQVQRSDYDDDYYYDEDD